jgi:23S rRNA (pseudouridine1915-N3)-methyltransferase
MLLELKNAGRKAAFWVGGPHGLDRKTAGEADRKLSLSVMTYPHELATVVIAEQIYRAYARCIGKAYAK